MMNAATAAALDRIATRSSDALGAYRAGYLPRASDFAMDGASTNVQPSLNPLDVVAPEGTYLVTSQSDGMRAYTRNGSLALRDGRVVDRDGSPILGFVGEGRTQQALALDPIDLALDRVRDLHIEADGSLAYTRATIDPRSGQRRDARIVVGRLALARFPAGTQPVRVDASRVAAPTGVVPHIGRAGDGNFDALRLHARDVGRVDPLSALERLQEAYQSFEALAAVQRGQLGLEKTATDLLK